jgi:hypothetical protein
MQKLRESGLAGVLQVFASSCVLSTVMVSWAWAMPESAAKAAKTTRTFFMGSPLGVCKKIINHKLGDLLH